jgi:chromosome segregation ATPase
MSELRESFEPSASPAARPGSGGLVGLLEERVTALVDRFREAKKTIDELQSALEERDTRLSDLTQRTDEADALRRDLKKRVNRLLDQVRRLEKVHGEDRA